jgi:hypothetical protein
MTEILDDRIYYVCFSDYNSDVHYMATHSDNEKEIDNWCAEIRKEFGCNTVKLKWNGKTLKRYLSLV